MTSTLFLLFLTIATGRIVDPSGRPVEGAKVTCGPETRTSDVRGTVEFPAPCDARVSKTGFADLTQALRDGQEIMLSLATSSERVVVTATGTAVALQEAGVAADIFTAKDFGPQRTPFVRDLLRYVPGLNLVQGGPNGGLTSLFIRGGNSDAGLILLDGIPLTEPGGRIDLAHLTSAGIERMEVVRGPVSTLFGAEAASGVIQLFSRQGDPEVKVPHGSMAYERGNFSTERWTAGLDGGLGNRLDYALTADQFRSTGQFANNAYRLTTGTANLGYRFSESTSLRGIFRTYDSYAGVPGQVYYGLTNLDAQERARDSAFGLKLDDARGSRYSQRATFNYHRNRDRFSDVKSEQYTVSALVRHVGDRTYLASPGEAGAVPVTSDQTLYAFEGLTYTNRASFNYQGTLAHRGGALVAGYEFERQAGDISSTDVTRRNNGGYIHEQYALTPRIFLTGGVRYEHSSTFGSRAAPRGAITIRLPQAIFLRASLGRGIKEPALIENFARETYYVGNPKLQPAKTDSFELGLFREWFGGRLRTEANYFRNSFKDLIVFDFSQFPSTWQNIDRSWGRGVETSAALKLSSIVGLRGSYTYLRTRITRTNTSGQLGRELLRRPRNTGSVMLELTPRRWTVLAGGRFVGESQDDDFFVFGVNRNPGYNVAFFSASWQATRHLQPYMRIDNAMDAHYQEALGYAALSRTGVGGLRVTW